MKIMILIPCMEMVHTAFMRSVLALNGAGHEVSHAFQSGSLVYDSRNRLIETAKQCRPDRVLWLDSDMDVPMDALQMLSKDIDEGRDIVTGLCVQRKPPHSPTIYTRLELQNIGAGQFMPIADIYKDYPADSVFEVKGCGGACVMMTMDAIDKITENYGPYPYMPVGGFGEDMSFCIRAQAAGVKMYCDSRIRVGHIGNYTYTEADYKRDLK